MLTSLKLSVSLAAVALMLSTEARYSEQILSAMLAQVQSIVQNELQDAIATGNTVRAIEDGEAVPPPVTDGGMDFCGPNRPQISQDMLDAMAEDEPILANGLRDLDKRLTKACQLNTQMQGATQ